MNNSSPTNDQMSGRAPRGDALPYHDERERVIWQAQPAVNPSEYFTLNGDRSWIEIISRGKCRAQGKINLFKRHLAKFFHTLQVGQVTDYADWACNPYPTGGIPLLLRMRSIRSDDGELDVSAPPGTEGMLCIDPDTLPSTGRLYLGNPDQELEQLAALWQLQPMIRALVTRTAPTEGQQTAAAIRAGIINAKVHESRLPTSGYCPWCECDVTLELQNSPADRRITGCPICHHTWCD